eukprot:TRINITY_DN773133_c0_g1_i1.p1 TRINITY_DN773133_c0_g1~~TRINITY_DN773133_c0_g1_i1.p1  ORF type:complete len:331 (-),score=62.68 TRINITY_DN773133_c0_g1_i1:310-1302(-)
MDLNFVCAEFEKKVKKLAGIVANVSELETKEKKPLEESIKYIQDASKKLAHDVSKVSFVFQSTPSNTTAQSLFDDIYKTIDVLVTGFIYLAGSTPGRTITEVYRSVIVNTLNSMITLIPHLNDFSKKDTYFIGAVKDSCEFVPKLPFTNKSCVMDKVTKVLELIEDEMEELESFSQEADNEDLEVSLCLDPLAEFDEFFDARFSETEKKRAPHMKKSLEAMMEVIKTASRCMKKKAKDTDVEFNEVFDIIGEKLDVFRRSFITMASELVPEQNPGELSCQMDQVNDALNSLNETIQKDVSDKLLSSYNKESLDLYISEICSHFSEFKENF